MAENLFLKLKFKNRKSFNVVQIFEIFHSISMEKKVFNDVYRWNFLILIFLHVQDFEETDCKWWPIQTVNKLLILLVYAYEICNDLQTKLQLAWIAISLLSDIPSA